MKFNERLFLTETMVVLLCLSAAVDGLFIEGSIVLTNTKRERRDSRYINEFAAGPVFFIYLILLLALSVLCFQFSLKR